jgi:hypothetical protein
MLGSLARDPVTVGIELVAGVNHAPDNDNKIVLIRQLPPAAQVRESEWQRRPAAVHREWTVVTERRVGDDLGPRQSPLQLVLVGAGKNQAAEVREVEGAPEGDAWPQDDWIIRSA